MWSERFSSAISSLTTRKDTANNKTMTIDLVADFSWQVEEAEGRRLFNGCDWASTRAHKILGVKKVGDGRAWCALKTRRGDQAVDDTLDALKLLRSELLSSAHGDGRSARACEWIGR